MDRQGRSAGRGPDPTDGELVKVLQGDRDIPIYWYQAPGICRRSEGAQVFLDPRFRTHCVTGPEAIAGFFRVAPVKDR